eukprot:3477376-Rhodomonas_salina.1
MDPSLVGVGFDTSGTSSWLRADCLALSTEDTRKWFRRYPQMVPEKQKRSHTMLASGTEHTATSVPTNGTEKIGRNSQTVPETQGNGAEDSTKQSRKHQRVSQPGLREVEKQTKKIARLSTQGELKKDKQGKQDTVHLYQRIR